MEERASKGVKSPPATPQLPSLKNPDAPGNPETLDFQWLKRHHVELFDSLAGPMVVVAPGGEVTASNAAWRKFAPERSASAPPTKEANHYSALLAPAFPEDAEEKDRLLCGIHCVLNGALSEYRQDVSLVRGGERCRYHLHAYPLLIDPGKHVAITLHDVTAKHHTEQALKESHALFKNVTENIGDGVFLYDCEGRIGMMNNTFASAFRLKPEEVVGKSIHEVFKPERSLVIQEQNALVLNSGQTLHFEEEFETPHGNRTFLVSKSVYRNHQKEATGILGIARDITERKHAKTALEHTDRRFRALIENSADAVSLVSEDGTIEYTSPAGERIFGYGTEEIVGTNAFLWLHPQDAKTTIHRFRELLELTNGTITLHYRRLHKQGEWLWIEASATNLLHDPCVKAIVINERNITERKHTETEVSRLAAIVESTYDAIIGADLDGNITIWNSGARHLFGFTENEVLGQNCSMLAPPDYQQEYEAIHAAAVRGKATENLETVRLAKDGRRIEVALTMSPIRDRERKIVGFSKIMRDITDQRRLERQILEISDREKQRIGQDLHDDLCQHLIGISIIGNLLYSNLKQLGNTLAEDARQVTELIRTAVDHARALARGLSPLNLGNSGFMTSIESLVITTEQMFRVPCAFQCKKPVLIDNATDATHLYRIAQEALHNAVKHSQATQVIVSLESTKNSIAVTVSDNGVGIPELKAPSNGGGLGMHTMQYRARTIGATLEFKRNDGGGTCVICRMPLQARGKNGEISAG